MAQRSKFKAQSSKFKAQNFSQILRFSGFQIQKKTYQLHIVNFQWCNWYVSTDDEFYNFRTKAFELKPLNYGSRFKAQSSKFKVQSSKPTLTFSSISLLLYILRISRNMCRLRREVVRDIMSFFHGCRRVLLPSR